jgi:two-component system, cell cycle sensor histidine kinase and response regulator CckA
MADFGSPEEQLLEAQRLASVGLLAAGIVHDFNNVLAVILTSTMLLRERLADRADALAELREIEVAASWGAALTKQLLAFARSQAWEPRLVDINELAARMQQMLRRLIAEHIELDSILPSPALVWADPAQLEQVLVNLGLNARDAMSPGRRLRIEISALHLKVEDSSAHPGMAPGRYVVVALSDTGHATAPTVLPQPYEPGLGLAISSGIMRRHGGHITVSSQAGTGTMFSLYLPQVEQDAPSSPPPASDDMLRGAETVLLAEDEAMVRSVAARTLRSLGYTVLEAAHGAEALELAARDPGAVHLLIADVVMPGFGGLHLADELRREHPGLKVLLTSGYPAEVLADAVLHPGVAFLGKPYDPTTLARRVREILG